MIKLTKMGGDEIIINAELIESVQATPDTVITMTTNKKVLVQDTVDAVVEKAVEYHRKVLLSYLEVKEGEN